MTLMMKMMIIGKCGGEGIVYPSLRMLTALFKWKVIPDDDII